MYNISSLLERFKKIKDPRRDKEEIISILKTFLNEDFSTDDIDFKNGILNVKGSGAIRTEIYMNKDEILSALNKKLPHLHLNEIK